MKVFFKMHFCINQKNTFILITSTVVCDLLLIILLVAINSINICIKICRRVAAYRQIHNFLHIILKKKTKQKQKTKKVGEREII